jgi:hypothetical protein
MKKTTFSSLLLATLLLSACGSGGSSSTTDNTTSNLSNNSNRPTEVVEKATGYYVDEAVEGVGYKCGKEEGNTSINGAFIFEKNKNCTFYLGDIKLREINSSILHEDNITILEDNETVARMLQSFDKDGNASNGIQLNHKLIQEILKENHIDEIPQDDAVLGMVIDELKVKDRNFTGRVIGHDEANEHLNETKENLQREGRRTQHDVNSSRERVQQHRGEEEDIRNQDNNHSVIEDSGHQRIDNNSSTIEQHRGDNENNITFPMVEQDRGHRDTNSTEQLTERENENHQENPRRGRR